MEDKNKEIIELQRVILIERQGRLLAEFELARRDLILVNEEFKKLDKEVRDD